MKINFNQYLKTLDGKEIPEVTLKSVAINALLSPHEDERILSGEDKVVRYKLATQIFSSEAETELTAEDIALIKKLIGKSHAPLAVGQAYEMLEGK